MDGKIRSITRYPGSTKKNLKFDYDAMGNRVAKHSYDSNNNWERSTYYWRDAQGNVMAVYESDFNDSLEMMSHRLTERHIYGSSRVGMDVTEVEMIGATDPDTTATQRALQYKQYEISNHLGNVLAVVTDMKVPVVDGNDSVQGYLADILTAQDYSPFGVLLYDRTFRSGEYRYGFNSQEKDDEISGNGNSYTAEFWQYDSRLGRRWNMDPKPNPSISHYATFANSPIWITDPLGDTTRVYNKKGKFLRQINDNLENEVHFVKNSTGNALRNYYQDAEKNNREVDHDKVASALRERSIAFAGKNTMEALNLISQKSVAEGLERGGVLMISETRELLPIDLSDNPNVSRSRSSFDIEWATRGFQDKAFAVFHTHIPGVVPGRSPAAPSEVAAVYGFDDYFGVLSGHASIRGNIGGHAAFIVAPNTLTIHQTLELNFNSGHSYPIRGGVNSEVYGNFSVERSKFLRP